MLKLIEEGNARWDLWRKRTTRAAQEEGVLPLRMDLGDTTVIVPDDG